MMEATHVFWQNYHRLVTEFFGSSCAQEGVPESLLSATEHRLGFRLPTLLREFYLQFGQHRGLTRSFDRLVHPEKLRFQANALRFYEDHQGVVFWGIEHHALAESDPPVCQANKGKRTVWYPDHDRLSDFFETMLYRQFLEGSEHSGMARIKGQTLTTIQNHWSRIELKGKNLGDVQIFAQAGQALAVFRQGRRLELLASGRTEQDLIAIGEFLGIVEELCGEAC